MGFEWLASTLAALCGIEPYEVRQALEEGHRWPRPSVGTDGVRVLAIWNRTRGGRPLIVVVRHTGPDRQWAIVGAWEMTADQAAEYDRWEAGHGR